MLKNTLFSAFYRSIIGSVFTNIIGLIISFIGSVLLTRILGAEGRGVVAWVTSLTVMGSMIAQFGMGHVNRKFIASKSIHSGDLFIFTLTICFLVSLVIIPPTFFWGIYNDIGRENKTTLAIALLTIPIWSISNNFGEMLIGLNKSKYYNYINITQKTSNTLCVIVLAISSILTPLNAVIAMSLSFLLKSILASFLILKNIKLRVTNPFGVLKYVKGYMGSNYLATICYFFSCAIMPILLGNYSSLKEIGWFAASMILIDAMRSLPDIIGLYLIPKLASMSNLREKYLLKRNILLFSSVFMSLSSLFLYYISNILLPLIFGQEFVGASSAFDILLIAFVFNGIFTITQSIIASEHNSFFIIVSPFLLFNFSLVTALITIPILGARGAAISWVVGNAIGLISSLIILKFKKI